MDGIDLSTIDQIDQDLFNGSPYGSDDCDEMPLPDCIGIDSALQDSEEARVNNENLRNHGKKSRTDEERELELKILMPNSIRRQILEKSIGPKDDSPTKTRSHVMNITEKAGMSGINKEKINQIIHEASKGSLFYKRQAQRQAEIHKSIEKMLNRVKIATPQQVAGAKDTCDKIVAQLEKQRVFNRLIVHFDLDMFFAAVEIRDNQDLKEKPVAVGGDSMISTSNYVARKFGVRAAMPGFIAKKLCPNLIIIKPNGFKYRQASSEVFAILEQYDPELTSMSLDEAYLDLTDYIKNTLERDNLELQEYYDGTLPKIWWSRAAEVVTEIRQSIFEKTKLTCSAGIACNTLLAKISTDINKPDGQFMVQGYHKDVIDFISKTPVEKVSGIGKVSVQFLNALDIKTCGDIFDKRHYLPLVFYEINVKFYLRVALGDGATSVKSDEQRKSKSVERTFSAIKDDLILLDKLDSICEELCSKYLKPYRIRGRTVTVKLKRNTFMTTTKSYSMLVATNDKLVIYNAAKNLLLSETANEPPEISYRLLGVKLSNLADDGVTTNQLTIDAMLRNQTMGKSSKSDKTVHEVDSSSLSNEVGEQVTQTHEVAESVFSEVEEVNCDGEQEVNQAGAREETKSSRRLSIGKIDTFFAKRSMTQTHVFTSSSSRDNELRNRVQYNDKEDEFFDAESHDEPHSHDTILNNTATQEQMQNQPHNEDFQCPYCFKPFTGFSLLERHVDECPMKIPIDVNRSFFSQRSQPQQSPASIYFSQFKPGGSKSKTSRHTHSQSASRTGKSKKQKIKVSPLNYSPASRRSSQANPNSQTSPISPGISQSQSARKVSYYERFIESNSQSLQKSNQIDPFQCPYCTHGFLTFSTLQSHVVMCTKKRSATQP